MDVTDASKLISDPSSLRKNQQIVSQPMSQKMVWIICAKPVVVKPCDCPRQHQGSHDRENAALSPENAARGHAQSTDDSKVDRDWLRRAKHQMSIAKNANETASANQQGLRRKQISWSRCQQPCPATPIRTHPHPQNPPASFRLIRHPHQPSC